MRTSRSNVAGATAGQAFARLVILAVALGATAGCLDDQLDPSQTVQQSNIFIAVARDFQPFMMWARTQVGDAEIVGGHAAGPRFAYVNGKPSGGSFPVGTMIVKTVEIGDPTTWTIHARAKRGGGENPNGAVGWEWFDLNLDANNAASIVWRGEKPPVNHGYESLPGLGATSSTDGDCNSCHGLATSSDYILAPALQAELMQ